MAERQITEQAKPPKADVALLVALFEFGPEIEAAILAGKGGARVAAKLEIIRNFRASAEGIAVLSAREPEEPMIP